MAEAVAVSEGEVQEYLPLFDALCITLNTFPEHVYAAYDTIRASMDAAVNAIGHGVRKHEFEQLSIVDGEVTSTEDTPKETADAGKPSSTATKRDRRNSRGRGNPGVRQQ